MTDRQLASSPVRRFWAVYAAIVRSMVYALVGVAALGIVVMMTITCLEVVLRLFGTGLKGGVDIIGLAAGVTMAAALPYTTACKGHVAIEYFFQKLGRLGRTVVDAVTRLCVIALFGFLTVECFKYGSAMRQPPRQVTPTLEVPEFWVPYVLAVSTAVVCLVAFYHLFHPGRELIKP